jgi:hypothetical protein
MRKFLTYKQFKLNENLKKSTVEIPDFDTFVKKISNVTSNNLGTEILSFVDFSKSNMMAFNHKYRKFIHGQGLSLNNQSVIDYLDNEFTNELKSNPEFYIGEIKIKLGTVRVLTNSSKHEGWEKEVTKLLIADGMNLRIF